MTSSMSRSLRIMTAILVVGFSASLAAQVAPSTSEPVTSNSSAPPPQAKARGFCWVESACEDGACESDCCVGVPILSKLPYVSRLFKNVGVASPHGLRFTVRAKTVVAEKAPETEDMAVEEAPKASTQPQIRIQLKDSSDVRGAISIDADVVRNAPHAPVAVNGAAVGGPIGYGVAHDRGTIKIIRITPSSSDKCACGADCACCATAVKLPSLVDHVGSTAGSTCSGGVCVGTACSSCGEKAVCAADVGPCGGAVCAHSGCKAGACSHDVCSSSACAAECCKGAACEAGHPAPPQVAWRDRGSPRIAIATFAAPPFTGMPVGPAPAHAGCPFKELHERLVAAETENAHLRGRQEGRESLTAALVEASVENAKLQTQVEVLGELVEMKEQHAKEKQELIEAIVEMQQEHLQELAEAEIENARLKIQAEVAEERRALFAQFAEAQVEMTRKTAELQTRAAQVEQQLHAIEQVKAENAALKARLAELTGEKSESRPVSKTATRPAANQSK